MDILSFALYHENNEVIDEAALNRKRPREEPITESSEGEPDSPEKDSKRQQGAPGASTESGIMEMKRAIYQQVSQSLEDSVPNEDLCVEVDDRTKVSEAVQSLEADGKVMFADGEVYLVD